MSLQPLKFIHITKTAGTSIENLAKEKNIHWGRFDKDYIKLANNIEQCISTLSPWHNNILNKPKNYDWFMVVRNPYDRIISEFHCKYSDQHRRIKCTNSQEFNNYIQNKIKYAIMNINIFQQHYAPQYKYYDDTVKLHVLKFENIETEFNNLMKEYSLDLTLNIKNNECNNKKYSIKDLNIETIKLINNVYDNDFKLFGYYKINPYKM